MKPIAIIYTSNTGHTETYANLLSSKLEIPAYSLSAVPSSVPKGSPVIYLGWLFANHVKGYKKAKKRYSVLAICGVGLCDTGALIYEIRKADDISEDTPLFTLQGGMDRAKLKGIYKLMINIFTASIGGKEVRTENDERMLSLLKDGGSYVSEANLFGILNWYKNI